MVTRSARRRTVWIEDDFTAGPVAGGQDTGVMDTQLPGDQKGYTLLRLLMNLHLLPSTLAVLADIHYGVCIIPGDMFDASVFPDPGSAEPFSWIMRDVYSWVRDADAGAQGIHRLYDLRSKRIMRNTDDRMIFVADAGATSAWTISVGTRSLWAIP